MILAIFSENEMKSVCVRVCGACVGCVGRVVWGVCGVAWGRGWCVCVGACGVCAGRGGEKVSLAAYYPDTFVNPDTCLG